MHESCLAKQEGVKKLFTDSHTPEAVYDLLIRLGREMPPLPEGQKTEENRVQGCQSRMYLTSCLASGRMQFAAASDALISAGLAALLIQVYNDEPPESVLLCPPLFLEELQIPHALSPSRANGLYSLHLRMKQEALKHLT